MTSVRITVSLGKPSTHYPADEQVRNGAMDHDVVIAFNGRTIAGGITLFPDSVNGGMSPCGSPIDVWCSGSIVEFAHALSDSARKELLSALASAPDDLEIGAPSSVMDIEIATPVTNRGEYLVLFPSTADAIMFENTCLSIADEFLPACAKAVRLGKPATADYWTWLSGQLAASDGAS